jgi:hypothetical protein
VIVDNAVTTSILILPPISVHSLIKFMADMVPRSEALWTTGSFVEEVISCVPMFNEADASTHHQLVYRDHSGARLHRGVPWPVSTVDRIRVVPAVRLFALVFETLALRLSRHASGAASPRSKQTLSD